MADTGDLAALLEAMLESSLDAVVTIDAAGRIVMFNRAAEQTFGFRAGDAIGQDVAELIIPQALRERHRHAFGRHLRHGERTILNRRVELTGQRADGSEFPVELTVTRVPVEGPPMFTAYLRDITERQRVEAELRASRTRVVESADRERRRIERNLHDGAQQRLLAIGVLLSRLALGRELPPSSLELVDLAQAETGRAIDELRELARGIHPASLTESGLPTALRGLALGVPLELTVAVGDARFPESVEVALFYVAAEALANVVKHARATHAELSLQIEDGRAVLRVTDNGIGVADAAGGSGLDGLRDRLEAIGGSLSIDGPVGAGTTVIAVAPIL